MLLYEYFMINSCWQAHPKLNAIYARIDSGVNYVYRYFLVGTENLVVTDEGLVEMHLLLNVCSCCLFFSPSLTP